MKFYVIEYENGAIRYGEFASSEEAINYAESYNGGYDFTISVYDSMEDYDNSIEWEEKDYGFFERVNYWKLPRRMG